MTNIQQPTDSSADQPLGAVTLADLKPTYTVFYDQGFAAGYEAGLAARAGA